MVRRLVILSVIILTALCAFSAMGFYAIAKWAEGLQAARVGEFAQVAEQIRTDVKHNLDQFMRREQNRPYTDYLYYHVPGDEAAFQQQAVTVVRSPLSGRLDHGLAYGHFQIQPDGSITTPNDDLLQRQGSNEINFAVDRDLGSLKEDVRTQLLPLFRTETTAQTIQGLMATDLQARAAEDARGARDDGQAKTVAKGKGPGQVKALPIESLQNRDQQAQVTQMDRRVVRDNILSNTTQTPRPPAMNTQTGPSSQMRMESGQQASLPGMVEQPAQGQPLPEAQGPGSPSRQQALSDRQVREEEATVTVRTEPLVPVVIRQDGNPSSIFDGQVFLVRHVRVADEHLLQGFRLDQPRLRAEIEDSATRIARDGMGFELSKSETAQAAYSAILDFGFGDLVLSLTEKDPGWIAQRIRWLYRWYVGTLAMVLVAVSLGLAGLWRGARQQLQLVRQKDDFISAVSHELRTPLTSIRMYAEMLEKGWVTSGAKQGRYYQGIRQESERLSRLIENVLDFSRVQRGRKRYQFAMGDINAAVIQVVEMMRPYATEHGFAIHTDLANLAPVTFDRDAVMQIVVNLVDNAVKFARSAQDKTLIVRSRPDDGHTLIEVEDHGPGVPPSERRKIFDEFYRIEPESTRQTTGTGLGLALVLRFAQAHKGFVRVTEASPHGAIFTVGLNVQ